MSVKKSLTLQEIIHRARRNLADGDWDYLVGGTETETTLRRNRLALDELGLRPRVLTDVSTVDTGGKLLGHDLRIPVILPPIGSMQVFHESAAAGVAEAAESFGTMSFLSSVSAPGLEATAAASEAPKVFQLYLMGDRDWMRERITAAIELGYVGFCLTVDTQVYSRRERDLLKRHVPASGRTIGVGDFGFQSHMTWDLVKWVKDEFDIPLVLKGIATAEDAVLACEHGVEVVYVSNHGGRQLDHGLGCAEVLPEVVEAVDGQAEIVVDGGFVRGTDVVKGIALGADAVGIGRLECWGLAAAGAEGVHRMLEILENEIQIALALLGVTSFSELGASHLTPAQPTADPHVTSAFPHLELPKVWY